MPPSQKDRKEREKRQHNVSTVSKAAFFSQETSTVQSQAEKAEYTLEFLYRQSQTGWCVM